MKQFRDILVYAETDDKACLEQVVSIAAAHGAAITVCEVIEPPPRAADACGVVDRLSRLRWSRAFQRLRRIVDRFAEHSVIDYSVFTGVPFVVITEQVVQQGFDLVVHISDPVQLATDIGLNATGRHLMRKCPCTIWALHPERSHHSSNIVLALDRERGLDSSVAEAFAISLAETALALSEARDGDVHVVHAWQAYGVEILDDPELGLATSDRAAYLEQQRRDAEQWFRGITQRIESMADHPSRVKAKLIEGPVLATVQQAVGDCAAGMLVLGTVGTSANPGVLIGATTESILAGCGTPVLALKPPGFVSPLTLARSRPVG